MLQIWKYTDDIKKRGKKVNIHHCLRDYGNARDYQNSRTKSPVRKHAVGAYRDRTGNSEEWGIQELGENSHRGSLIATLSNHWMLFYEPSSWGM